MWHACEEGLSSPGGAWWDKLTAHVSEEMKVHATQRAEIAYWSRICYAQFTEYVKYWREHDDVRNRTPIAQEKVFDVRYPLPSGRTARLRGKFDAVDVLGASSVFLQENKTKSELDEVSLQRRMQFDVQSMMYLTVLGLIQEAGAWRHWGRCEQAAMLDAGRIAGVLYNVVRRPLSGGKGSIKPHAAKTTKKKYVPAETEVEFIERLRRDYIAAEPDKWFYRVKCHLATGEVERFKRQFLTPILESLCDWYDWVTSEGGRCDPFASSLHWRYPFGVYNAIDETGASEYDAFLATGSEAGMSRVTDVFPELKT